MRFDLLPERLRLLSSFRRRRENESLHLHFTRTHGLPPPSLQNLARHLGGENCWVTGRRAPLDLKFLPGILTTLRSVSAFHEPTKNYRRF